MRGDELIWKKCKFLSVREIVTELLGKDLIKSSNIFPCVQLLYKWAGTINMDDEVKMMLKTTSDKYGAIEEFIAREHP